MAMWSLADFLQKGKGEATEGQGPVSPERTPMPTVTRKSPRKPKPTEKGSDVEYGDHESMEPKPKKERAARSSLRPGACFSAMRGV